MTHISKAILLALSLMLAGCTSIQNQLSTWTIDSVRALAHLQARQVQVGNFMISYLEGGQGETVFLIHGFQSNKDIWIKLAAELTQHYHVIAIDLPAHGNSTVLMDQNYSIPEQTQRVVAIMEKLQLTRPVHVMGHSMGGAIALYLTVTAPEHVKSLALMSAAGVTSPTPSELMTRLQHGENPLIVHNEQDYKNMLAFTMTDAPFIPSPLLATLTREAIAREPIATKIFKEIQAKSSINIEQAMRQIKVPTLVIWGDKDRVLDVSSTTIFQDLIPKTQVVILKNVGHTPQLERTKDTALAYETFLAALP
ncbi:alpha/beta fold hydrolase [soil metagenome]